jgi:hypothetical protein
LAGRQRLAFTVSERLSPGASGGLLLLPFPTFRPLQPFVATRRSSRCSPNRYCSESTEKVEGNFSYLADDNHIQKAGLPDRSFLENIPSLSQHSLFLFHPIFHIAIIHFNVS